jgi:hypothetical protein
MMWLPEVIGRWAAMFKTHPGDMGMRFGSAGLESPTVVGSLRPDAIGNAERRLPGFYIGGGEEIEPWGDGGVPLTAHGNPLHDASGNPLV